MKTNQKLKEKTIGPHLDEQGFLGEDEDFSIPASFCFEDPCRFELVAFCSEFAVLEYDELFLEPNSEVLLAVFHRNLNLCSREACDPSLFGHFAQIYPLGIKRVS